MEMIKWTKLFIVCAYVLKGRLFSKTVINWLIQKHGVQEDSDS